MTASHTPKRPYDRNSFILIVDDDNTLLKFFKIHLNKFFSRVIVVENAKQALDAFKDKEIDLLLTDVRMPKVDGFQLMQKVRKAHPNLPILLISGEPMNKEQEELLGSADGFLTKPFTVDQLNDFINRGIDLRQTLLETTEQLKDPKKIRDFLKAKTDQVSKFAKKDQSEKAKELHQIWQKQKNLMAS